MRHLIYEHDNYSEYVTVMHRVRRALRHGDINEVKAWIAIAERLLNMQSRHEGLRTAWDKRDALHKEQPHRLKLLEGRARWAGS